MTTEEEIKVPKDWAPIFIWNDYLYKQQKQFTLSKAWANWFVSGNGCFGKGTKVLMYDGSVKNVEDVKIGDVLMGDDSTPRNVLRLAKGSEPLYEFEFKEKKKIGTKYVFNENHILYLESVDYESPIEVTVKDYLTWSKRKQRAYHFVRKEVEWDVYEDLEIPPYILGLWLGDGDSNGRRFSNIDEEVINVFSSYIESINCEFNKSDKWHYQIIGKNNKNNGGKTNNFCKLLEKDGVRKNKHIPRKYLFASKYDRLELLAGLIDTDGSYRNGGYNFYQSNKQLSEQVQFLSRSLGFNAQITTRNRGIGKEQYIVDISRNVKIIPCRIKRKKYDYKAKRNSFGGFGIRKITSLGNGDFYGFTLDGNHRFLGADFTVLRNTGKTLVFYFNIVLYLLGIHPNQLGAKKDEKTGKVTAPPLKIRVLVPSFDHVRDVALEKLTQRQRITQANLDVGPLLPKSMVKQGYSKEHKGIELKNGAALWWVTSEQGWEVMRGGEQDILGMDEEGDENVFNQLKRGLRNAMAGGKILGVLTPPYLEGQGPTWTKEAVVDAALDDPDVFVVNSCMKDNPAITKDFIRRWTKGKSKEQVDVEVYGKYPSWGKMLFYAWQDREWDEKVVDGHILPMDMDIPKNHEVDWVMAFDWHQSKPCAAVWGYVDRDGNVVILDELDKEMAENKDISELVEIFKQIEGQPFSKRKWRRWQDPSAKHKYNALRKDFNAWDEFKRHGVLTTEGRNRDPEVGISIVNDYLKGNMKDHPRLFVRENCKYVRQYMNNHYWKKGKGDGKPTPDAKWSDYPICVRYILQELGYKDKKKDRKPYPYYSFQTEDDNKKVINLERFIG